tara:strand:- start:3190 stop:3537 length:348 start_codon:yes stop_codon:yes gene_type:complete
MTPANYIIPNHYKGDTFDSITFSIKEDGVAVNLTGAQIKINFRIGSNTGNIQQSMLVDSGLTIQNATDGVFTLDEFVNDWDANKYFYDTQITFLDGVVRTYFKGTIIVDQNNDNE